MSPDADTEPLPDKLLLPPVRGPSFRHFPYNPSLSDPFRFHSARHSLSTSASLRVSFICQAKRSNMVPRERSTPALPPRPTEEVWKRFSSPACSLTCASDYTSASAVDLCLYSSVQEMKKTSYNKAKLREPEENQVLCCASAGSGV